MRTQGSLLSAQYAKVSSGCDLSYYRYTRNTILQSLCASAGFFEGCDINKHLDECAPSPIKKQDDGENDDEMVRFTCIVLLI